MHRGYPTDTTQIKIHPEALCKVICKACSPFEFSMFVANAEISLYYYYEKRTFHVVLLIYAVISLDK